MPPTFKAKVCKIQLEKYNPKKNRNEEIYIYLKKLEANAENLNKNSNKENSFLIERKTKMKSIETMLASHLKAN